MPRQRVRTPNAPSESAAAAAPSLARRLLESEQALLSCLQQAPDGVVVIDADARILAFNQTAEAL